MDGQIKMEKDVAHTTVQMIVMQMLSLTCLASLSFNFSQDGKDNL